MQTAGVSDTCNIAANRLLIDMDCGFSYCTEVGRSVHVNPSNKDLVRGCSCSANTPEEIIKA